MNAAPPVPTFTFTRTVVRYMQGGKVVKEVEIPGPHDVSSYKVERLAEVVEAYFDAGLNAAEILRRLPPIPPWVSLSIPPPPREPALREIWRRGLNRALYEAYDLERRRSHLLKILEELGSPPDLVERAQKAANIEELVPVEKEVTERVRERTTPHRAAARRV